MSAPRISPDTRDLIAGLVVIVLFALVVWVGYTAMTPLQVGQ
jgi:hypothetical protein